MLQSEIDRVTEQWQQAARQQEVLHAEVAALKQEQAAAAAAAQSREHEHETEAIRVAQQLHEIRGQLDAARDSSCSFEGSAAAANEALRLLRSCCLGLEQDVALAQAVEAEVRGEMVMWQAQARRQDEVVQQLQEKVVAVEDRCLEMQVRGGEGEVCLLFLTFGNTRTS